MSIQFRCTSCQQAIETDDEMAGQNATCPYCRQITPVPLQSNLTAAPDASAEQTAFQSGTGTAPPTPPIPLLSAPARPKSVLGWVALVCIVVGIGLTLYFGFACKALVSDLDIENTPPEEIRKIVEQRAASKPGLQVLGLLGSCAMPLVSVACAIVLLVKGAAPRWPAIVTLCIIGVVFVGTCAAVMMRAGSPAPGAGG